MNKKCYVINENTLCAAINAEEGRYEVIATLPARPHYPAYLNPKEGEFTIGEFDMIRIAMMDDFNSFSTTAHGVTDGDTQKALLKQLPCKQVILSLMSNKLADIQSHLNENIVLQAELEAASDAVYQQFSLAADHNNRAMQLTGILQNRHQALVTAFDLYNAAPSPALLDDVVKAQEAFNHSASRVLFHREFASNLYRQGGDMNARLIALTQAKEANLMKAMKLAHDLRLGQQIDTPVCK
ncbi:hypothetical protein [Aeromonas caviae]|uniref:hypothetical protein n=1 Tax=Aeromonas caviae TaxID=648 RepID=UPI00385C7F16